MVEYIVEKNNEGKYKGIEREKNRSRRRRGGRREKMNGRMGGLLAR